MKRKGKNKDMKTEYSQINLCILYYIVCMMMLYKINHPLSSTYRNTYILVYFSILFYLMQKHQQWIDNRTYQQHLSVLTKIKSNFRSNFTKSATRNCRRKDSQRHHSQQSPNSHDEFIRSSPNQKQHKSIKMSCKQREMLWNNFLLGKRILQTNPVISVKKQEDQYRKHKKFIDWRLERSKKLVVNTDFRQTKLKQYELYSHRLNNCHRLQTAARSKHILCLLIKQISLSKPHHFDNLVLKVRSGKKQKQIQRSQIVNREVLFHHEFFFKYTPYKKQFAQSNSKENLSYVMIEFYEIKGLEQRYTGYCILQRELLGSQQISIQAEIMKTGKKIGSLLCLASVKGRNLLKETF